MAILNKVQLIGNLGNDPELKGKKDNEVISFSVATKDTHNPDAAPEWHKIVAFKKQAVTIAEHMKKGSAIYLEGRLKTKKYEKDGHTFYLTEIMLNHFQFI
ncbi:MAG: single-stranded DNA-binding protein [Proteobacteria bacterium]|nr:single-stranded DNA-binding protein [Pseudomonadota bacterium]MBU1586291.1 single-stranded DNA-binding protein [Pseudomonadota bacterium]MBU2453187.1 single-stranded DNA-binding protein [Pseudomonadota bacterium]MBU2630782.1 single-stranded DNA-binding protein [Pseudomonadota bacterium]